MGKFNLREKRRLLTLLKLDQIICFLLSRRNTCRKFKIREPYVPRKEHRNDIMPYVLQKEHRNDILPYVSQKKHRNDILHAAKLYRIMSERYPW
jgi:hypothetical protein